MEQQKLEQQYRELLVLVEEKERQIVKKRIKNRSPRKPDRAVKLSIESMSNKNKANSKMNQRSKWQTQRYNKGERNTRRDVKHYERIKRKIYYL